MGAETEAQTCIVKFSDIFLQCQLRLRGRGNLCDKEGKALHMTYYTMKQVNRLVRTFYDVTYVHFSPVRT
jgi:hypothetical protein